MRGSVEQGIRGVDPELPGPPGLERVELRGIDSVYRIYAIEVAVGRENPADAPSLHGRHVQGVSRR